MKLGEIRHKRILILGFGVEGQASYSAIRNLWPDQSLLIADQTPFDGLNLPDEVRKQIQDDAVLQLWFGPSYLDAFTRAEVVIKSPGIPPAHAAVRLAVSMQLPVTSYTEIFFSEYPLKNIIGITGTKGKSTTASLIHSILRSAGRNVSLTGNIGHPPPWRTQNANAEDFVVFELSSHQLASLKSSPHLSVLLNLYPEHLDYYDSMAEYANAKENITRHQTADDFLVYNFDDAIVSKMANRSRAKLIPFSRTQSLQVGCYRSGDHFIFKQNAGDQPLVLPAAQGKLIGQFNLNNILAAVAVAAICGVTSEQIMTGINNFEPLPHRLEFIGTHRGVEFYDNSIATIPEATIAALDALGDRVTTLILGGFDRGSGISFEPLVACLEKNSVRTLILFPETGAKIWQLLIDRTPTPKIQAFHAGDMKTAVELAYQHTGKGEICLLSPASSSFGLFKDFKDRGRQFKNNVLNLGGKEEFRGRPPEFPKRFD